jgi:hypothetical protein
MARHGKAGCGGDGSGLVGHGVGEAGLGAAWRGEVRLAMEGHGKVWLDWIDL